VASGNIIAFTNKILDTHGAYDTSLSRFTAPVSGLYQVQAEAFAAGGGGSNTGLIINISKNGIIFARAGAGAGAGFERSSNPYTLIVLNAGDYIDVRITYITGSTAIEGTDGHLFSGFLVALT